MERLRKIGFSKLTSLEIAMEKVSKLIVLTKEETEFTNNSFNRVLAESVVNPIDSPPFDRAAMDGYAVKAEDTFNTSLRNPITLKKIGKIEIGELSNLELKDGEAIRISTGAAIPKGADSVLKIEDTEIENEFVKIFTSLVPGKNVSKKGEDVKKGQVLLDKGITLKARHIALLTSMGIDKVKVREKPKVSIISVGDELIEVGKPLPHNKIYNSNLPMISTLTSQYGANIISEKTIKDDKDTILRILQEDGMNSNVIIFTGGTSVGTKDFLPEIMKENGNILVHGIAIRPGTPILIGQFQNTIVFCLPGTPVAAFICFLTIVGPTIKKLLGALNIDPRVEILAKIDKDVPVSKLGYINFLRVKIKKIENQNIAIPIRLRGTSMLSSLTLSDGIVEIPPFKEGLKKDEIISVKLYP